MRAEVRNGRSMAEKTSMPSTLSARGIAASQAPCNGGAAGGNFRRIAHFFGAKTSFHRRTRSFAGPKKCRVRRTRAFAGPAEWQVRRTRATKYPTLAQVRRTWATKCPTVAQVRRTWIDDARETCRVRRKRDLFGEKMSAGREYRARGARDLLNTGRSRII